MVWSLQRVNEDQLPELRRALIENDRFRDIDLREPPSEAWLTSWCEESRLVAYWGATAGASEVLIALVRDGGLPYFEFWPLRAGIPARALRSVLTEFVATAFTDQGIEEILYYLDPGDRVLLEQLVAAGFEELESDEEETVLRLLRKRFQRGG